MDDVITDVQREVMINSGNTNQLQIDVDIIRYDVHHLSTEINQITIQVNMLEQTLKGILDMKLYEMLNKRNNDNINKMKNHFYFLLHVRDLS
jgi:hypothetical protein